MNNELAIFGGPKTINAPGPHFVWPLISQDTEKAVLDQLQKSVSIYNRSGIIKEFEDRFASYHGRKYALLNNSGTSSIYAMFEGIDLRPGDEVLCPTYTFFATVTPMLHTGAKPVFVDSLKDGNIDPDGIRRGITPNTKAIIVTHMWGIPCDMDEIVSIAREHNIKLLEDCSHAHGALYKNKKVGTFGDAAAWSFQGQKIITGGEGGILLTDDEEIYVRSNLLGHYNKRCLQEIPDSNPLKKFAITGFGQKFRAHPLAVAMANEQFDHLDEWLKQKRAFADKLIEALKVIPFLKMPEFNDKDPSWYAFVMQFDQSQSSGLDVVQFAKALHAEGLCEVDLPRSTQPIHELPIFQGTDKAIPRLYKTEDLMPTNNAFPNAQAFYKNAIKLPVWVRRQDEPVLLSYISGILKVSDKIRQNVTDLLKI